MPPSMHYAREYISDFQVIKLRSIISQSRYEIAYPRNEKMFSHKTNRHHIVNAQVLTYLLLLRHKHLK